MYPSTSSLSITTRAPDANQTMTDVIPTGAYVIRNKETMTVIHIARTDVAAGSSSILSHQRDEIRHRDHQIWWIERLPQDGESTGRGTAVYSITNIPGALSLDVKAGKRNEGAEVIAYGSHGDYRQQWRFHILEGQYEGEWSITGAASGLALAFFTDPKPDTNTLKLADYNISSSAVRWEFIKPLVEVPAGWVEIINSGSGETLSQTYLSIPPRLIKPKSSRCPPWDRASWSTQWTIEHPTSYKAKEAGSQGKWIIKNRLTGGRLQKSIDLFPGDGMKSVVAEINQRHLNIWDTQRWTLELEGDNTWKIQSKIGGYLEGTENLIGAGKEVICVSPKSKPTDSTKIWSFRKVIDK